MQNLYFYCCVATTTISVFLNDLKAQQKENSVLEKVAYAHGFENWKKVNELQFTFNVDRPDSHFERSWVWKTKTNDITAESDEGTLKYNRASMDSAAHKTNGGFINDKFWLLMPYQLIWDADNIEHKHIANSKAPISKKEMHKLTVVYGNEGGYTPGDAYDLYFEDDYIIKEWAYRKANGPEPSLITTFEDYKIIEGLKIATMYKTDEGDFKLYFTNLGVQTD